MVEENRSLEVQIAQLQRGLPADQTATLQKLTFLEGAVRQLESERSALLVRATVAEEQLNELQRHLKEMTEGYQMQILNLKLEARAG
eukprot:gnl/TRDRNA2_/TRDRNA2_128651_c1_seq3.p3 gnl/TRDRNA2_/TRDRNA2_128651_c1~~gnl/TRDRNA2_/TRDRNA2_128651_c1_seq3.p3  ORF type:complete len:101 (-),score=33.67 gnl/TRDRNA2_/TRDRNA2_128651_c1_seq3:67-327(-)